jgi:DhnA family fructose-bisphosphate aldolase class Ia
MTGKELRLKRLFSRSDKLVVAAIDHGASMGPIKGLENLRETCAKLLGCDAVLMMPGVVEHVAHLFASASAPSLIVRLAWNSTYSFQWKYREARHTALLSAGEAVALGADAVLCSLSIHTGREQVDAENIGLFAECVQQAHALGLPIVGEVYPAGTERMPRKELHENIRIGCRVASELGADLIKTFYTGPRFPEIVASTPVPILTLGAEKLPTERAALELAARAVRDGAAGIVFGRNIFQSCAPERFVKAVRAVVNESLAPAAAVRQYRLSR